MGVPTVLLCDDTKTKTISDQIRILSEVEKIWIRHDLNDDGELEY